MPLYEYECRQCKSKFEDLQPMDSPSVTDCECGGVADRLIGMVSIGLCDTTMLKTTLKTRDMLDEKGDTRSEIVTKMAKESGISTAGKWYDPSLALYVGDPMAWVGSIDDIKQVCKVRGWDYKMVDGHIQVIINADIKRDLREQFGGKDVPGR